MMKSGQSSSGSSTMTAKNKRSFEFLSLSLVLGLLTAIGSLAVFAWLTDEVLEGDSRYFDDTTRAAVHQLASPALTLAMRGISFLGSTVFLILATAAIVLWFATRGWRREAILLTITMLGAALLNTTLKLAFKRPRPVPFFNLLPPESYSFPSGHSLASCCFFGALAAILSAHIAGRKLRAAIWIAATAMFLLIGFSRIYLGVHYTTDVMAGFAAALIWIMAVRFVETQLARRRNRQRDSG